MPARTLELDGRIRERWNNDATPTADGTPAKSVRFYDAAGAITSTRAMTAAEQAAATAAETTVTREANKALLIQRAKAFQTSAATFLAIGAPTQAQTLAQVQRNTKAINALIKLALDDLNDTAGTV